MSMCFYCYEKELYFLPLLSFSDWVKSPMCVMLSSNFLGFLSYNVGHSCMWNLSARCMKSSYSWMCAYFTTSINLLLQFFHCKVHLHEELCNWMVGYRTLCITLSVGWLIDHSVSMSAFQRFVNMRSVVSGVFPHSVSVKQQKST